jgi:hypothetical protein
VLAGVGSIADLDVSLVNAVETALDLLTEGAE